MRASNLRKRNNWIDTCFEWPLLKSMEFRILTKRMKALHTSLLLLVGVAGLTVDSLFADVPNRRKVDGEYKGARILARFVDSAEMDRHRTKLNGMRCRVARKFNLVPGLVVLEPESAPLDAKGDLDNTSGKEGELNLTIANLRASGLFRYVEPDYLLKAYEVPSDSAFTDGTLWGLRNTGQSGGVFGTDIGAERAWDVSTGSTNVIVAVIDSGIRYTHRDLASQMWRNPGEIPGNGRDDDRDGYIDNVFGINAITGSGNPFDRNDHGTHVAGTIGAAANNGHPHVGVAWNTRLMACKFLDRFGSGSTSDAIECINFAVDNGARILNNSWGGIEFSQAMLDAIARARDRGVFVVAAAGNEGRDNDRFPSYPGSFQLDNVISVGAVDRDGVLADFSNFGSRSVHVAAPGVDIFSTGSRSDTDYEVISGSSMATAHASGVAALLLSRFPDSSLIELRQRLLLGAVALEPLGSQIQSSGFIRAPRALEIASDGVLEVAVSTSAGTILSEGSRIPVFVAVSDLFSVMNAQVTVSLPGSQQLVFLDDGRSPDSVARDGTYSRFLTVPTDGDDLLLTVSVTASGKEPHTSEWTYAIQRPPVNDSFANGTVIDQLASVVTGVNLNATAESGEPASRRTSGGKTVWWSWSPLASGVATVSTIGSNFDTLLSVYTGSSVDRLALKAFNDDVQLGMSASQVIFEVDSGIDYRIVVDGFRGDSGEITLNVALNEPITNSRFSERLPVSDIDVTLSTSNFGAFGELGEPRHVGQSPRRSVWWSWAAPRSGPVIISTVGSTFDTVLAVYRGSSFEQFRLVANNDDIVDFEITASQVQFNAAAGRVYEIAVDGFRGAVGNIRLSFLSLPANDLFDNRSHLTGWFAEGTSHNLGARKESGEPDHAGDRGGQSVWWSWTAPASGNATFTTVGSTFDTVLAIYQGTSMRGLLPVASNDDADKDVLKFSSVTFQAIEGEDYVIAVDGFNSLTAADSGLIALTAILSSASRINSPIQLPDGRFKFTLAGEPDRRYVIQSSSDLTQWSSISTNTLVGKSFSFVDPASVESGVRYYRAFPSSLIGSAR